MTAIWDEATELEGTPLLVALCIADHAQDESGEAWPSIARICTRVRRSERAVYEALAVVEESGWMERIARPGRSNVYRMLLPTPAVGRTPAESAPLRETAPTPAVDRTPPLRPTAPITINEPPLETTSVVKEVDNSLGDPTDSPPVPSSGQSKSLPVVRRRQLLDAGVAPNSGPAWEQAWTAAMSVQWPDGMEMEAEHYADEHLMQHIQQSGERGYALSPSRWLQFFIEDRPDQIERVRARREQLARMGEDPAERENRQNRHLPPDRTDLDPPTTQAGVQP